MRASTSVLTAILLLVLSIPGQARAQAPSQETFATPEQAATTLMQALKTDDRSELLAIFGPEAQQVMSSGDPTADKNDRELFYQAMKQSWRWEPRSATTEELVVGDEKYPFAIPLVKKGNAWQFDTTAGKQEVLARRVGRNELAVIDICRTYVEAQREYASDGHDGKQAGLYAQKFRSDPGTQDGLYWSVKPGEKLSPLGDFAAQAAKEGYVKEGAPSSPSGHSPPFHGYYFRILTGQGRAAPGGAKSYVLNGDMSGRFALIAYPAKYGDSGVMTFVVNQDGVVYQKDLGSQTATLAGQVTAYNPDKSWSKANAPRAEAVLQR